MEFNDISTSLQWCSINGTSGLKQVTTFNILTPAMFRDQILNQHVKIAPGANFLVSGLNNKELPYLGKKIAIMAVADRQACQDQCCWSSHHINLSLVCQDK